ncbi:undecaprenyl-diphosphate phosphatase [Poriferisphaera sp. WC338]|uniref:undecaprenyl-diphosphate phosphatase n=1 Tax=Poriferisphaera sp. WC338 TaxID=3425129 RepID=UPI003D81806C
MNWWQAIILGIVEGLTEYLPVSSTGHLILVQRALGLTGDAADAFAICIQAGAIIAVLGLYWKRIIQMAKGSLAFCRITKTPDPEGFRLALNIILAFLPAAFFGLLFDDIIEEHLFHPWPIAFALFAGGFAILAIAWTKKFRAKKQGISLEELKAATNAGNPITSLTAVQALIIGFIQCLAMWPGTSRSLVTIVGGLIVGLSVAAAVEFSFLLGLLTLLAATVYKAKTAGPVMLDAYGWTPMIIGSLAAWLSAVIAVKWMVAYLKKHGLQLFGYYRIILAILVAILILQGFLSSTTATSITP